MKQQWVPQELIDHWTLSDEEIHWVTTINKTVYNRLGCALLLKYFQIVGKFPQQKHIIPSTIIEHVANQLQIQSSAVHSYPFQGRTTERHRAQIRTFLDIRMGTVADANAMLRWLGTQKQLLEEHKFDRLKEIVYERYKELKIEPPQPGRIDRIIRSALNSADAQFYTSALEKLQPETRKQLEALLSDMPASQQPTKPSLSSRTPLPRMAAPRQPFELLGKSEPGTHRPALREQKRAPGDVEVGFWSAGQDAVTTLDLIKISNIMF